MSKVLAAVAGVALLATGIGAIAGAAVLGTTVAAAAATVSIAGISLATIATIGTIAGIASSLIGAIEGGPAPPARAGVENNFVLDPNAGIPYVVGRTGFGGRCVHRRGFGGSDNPYYTYVVEWSGGGPIDGIEAFQANGETVTFSGGNAIGYYHDWMWFSSQLGATPESSALTPPFSGFPLWGSAYKMSGHAAYMYTLKFDKDGKVYSSGQPEPRVVGRGVKVYDPRLDSTYPGGSGSCRALVESTYVYSESGPLHALTWLLGRWQNGKKVLGVGSPPTELDVAAFVDAANTSAANDWKVGAALDGSADKWNNLKLMLQAGGAEPMDLGGYISCFHERPRTSIATIGPDDLAAGEIVLPAMRTVRARINGIIPRFRSETNNWQIVPATLVQSATYLAEDGEEKAREQEYGTVQDATHASQLAAYDIANGREADGIVLPLKLRWIGYRPGDCVTINLPEDGINNLKVIIRRRAIDPKTGTVTMTFRTETDAKHPWALGLTGSGPPSATVITGEANDTVVDENDTATAGPPGADAKTLYVTSTFQTITYDAAGALSPSSQTNTFDAVKQNTTGTVAWTITDNKGNALTPATFLSATTGNSVTMTAANFSAALAVNGATGLTVIGTIATDSLSDKISVAKVQAGAPGATGSPGVSAKTLTSAYDTVNINADYTGAIYSGQIGSKSNKCTFKDGATDVSASTTWTRTDSSAGSTLTTSIDANGLVVLTAMTETGSTTVQGVYAGGAPITKTINWQLDKDAAPPTTSNSAYIPVGVTLNNNSYQQASGTYYARAAASGVLAGAFSAEYYVNENTTTGGVRLVAYMAYRVAGSGGSWTAFSGTPSYTSGSNSSGENLGTNSRASDPASGDYEVFPGSLYFTQNTTGLTSGTQYEVTFFYRRSAGLKTADANGGMSVDPT